MQSKKPKRQESQHQKSKINNETSRKYRSLKPNNKKAVILWLSLAIIPANSKLSGGANLRCLNPSDIARVSKITHKFVGCTPCPPCPPTKEYSIPCGTTAYAGTKSECISCPSGKYSDGFNTKPCISCTLCSNKVVKQNCTASRNSVCGDCKPGYYLENPLFGCVKCSKCCRDGQDQIHPSCSAVNLCKPRPSGCPAVPTKNFILTSIISTASIASANHNHTLGSLHIAKSTTTPEEKETLRSINSSNTGQSDVEMIGTTKPRENILFPVYSKQLTQNHDFSNPKNPWFIVFLVFSFAVIMCVAIIAFKLQKKKKSIKDVESVVEAGEYELVSQDPNTQSNSHTTSTGEGSTKHEQIDPTIKSRKMTSSLMGSAKKEHIGQDPSRSQIEESKRFAKKTLQQFLHENYDDVDKLCNFLYKEYQGLFDFERVAKAWRMPEEDEIRIRAEIHARNGSPVRKLLEALCTWKPQITVKELADSIKDFNKKAYEVLKPHFIKPTEERDRIVD